MDTGMGREGYSIIGQGRVDEILSTKSARPAGDLRGGGRHFQATATGRRRRSGSWSARRKIWCGSTTRSRSWSFRWSRCGRRRKQAKKYLVLRDELRLLEISVWLDNLEALKADARKLEIDLRDAEQERDEARSAHGRTVRGERAVWPGDAGKGHGGGGAPD